MQETQVQALGQEDPLEKEMATHSSILAWEISWTEKPGGLYSMGLQRVLVTTEWLTLSLSMNNHCPQAAMSPRHHQLKAHEFEQAPGHGEG